MTARRATLLVFVFVGLAAAIVALGSIALAAGIRAAEDERNDQVLPRPIDG